MHRPRIVFAGTPDFSVPCLEALLEQEVEIVGIYTQPDRAAGRGKKLQQSPVKQRALAAGLSVYQPESFRAEADRETLAGLQPDLMVVVAYGLLLPQSVLDIPTFGCVNIHASLLPRWRGAAPIQRAIEAGDTQSGVCLMQMEKGLDTGPVLAQRECPIGPEQTGGELHDELSQLGATLLKELLGQLLAGKLQPVEQADTGVCYAHKLTKQETRVDWNSGADEIANKVRAFNPWPVASTVINGQTVRLFEVSAESEIVIQAGQPGAVIHVSPQGIRVATGEQGSVVITRLQKPGGKVLDVRDFLNGFDLSPGQRFE